MQKFARDARIFGTHSAEKISSIFEIFNSLTCGVAGGFPGPALSFMSSHAQGWDGFHRDYHNGAVRLNRYTHVLRKMTNENIFGSPVWAISLKGIRRINHFSIESAKLARGRQMPELDQLPFPKVQVLGFKRMVSGIGNESTTAGGCIVQMIQSITLAFCDGLGGHGVLL